jgi:hypothetical protein
LIINEALLEYDVTSVQKYPLTSRTTYMLFQQIAKITLDKDALIHDDRVDALAGAARFWVERLAQDSQRMINQAQMQNNVNFFANPFGRSNRNTAMQNTIHKYARRH